jgi:hypothetical protein
MHLDLDTAIKIATLVSVIAVGVTNVWGQLHTIMAVKRNGKAVDVYSERVDGALEKLLASNKIVDTAAGKAQEKSDEAAYQARKADETPFQKG